MPVLLPVMAAAAAAGEPPIIDLDSTLFLQLGLFLLAAFLLSRFLFRPYLKVRAAREAGIDGAREQAHRLDEEAKTRLADYQGRLEAARLTAASEHAKVRDVALQRDRERETEARTRTQAELETARVDLESATATARRALEPRTQEIARAIARRLLGREVA